MDTINYELYKVFYYVSKHLSFSIAAQQLFITQSAVSQAIKALESKLNCKLFVRSGRNIILTVEGETLFKYIEQACNFILNGERSIIALKTLKSGEVKIASSDTICRHYLLSVIKEFNAKFPQIKIKITNRTSPICIDLLSKGFVDICIVNIPDKLPDNIMVKEHKHIQDVFAAGRHYISLTKKTISILELTNYPLLMLEKNTVTRQHFDSLVTAHGQTIIPEIELGSIDLLIDLAKIGLGIAFISQEYIATELTRGELLKIKLKEHIPSRTLGLLINTKLPLSPAAEKFTDVISTILFNK